MEAAVDNKDGQLLFDTSFQTSARHPFATRYTWITSLLQFTPFNSIKCVALRCPFYHTYRKITARIFQESYVKTVFFFTCTYSGPPTHPKQPRALQAGPALQHRVVGATEHVDFL
jgi:hypothetical protein